MRKRRFLYGIAAALSGVACLFRSCGHFTASAADTQIQLTPSQTRALFGDILSGSYYDVTAGDYQTLQFEYLATTQVSQGWMRGSFGDNFNAVAPAGTTFLIYQSSISHPTVDTQYYTVQLQPVLNLGMLTRFGIVAGFSSQASYDDTTGLWQSAYTEKCSDFPYNSWSIIQNGNILSGQSADRWTTNSNIYDWLSWGLCSTSQTNTRFFVPNIINLSSDSYFSVSNFQITRQGYCGATATLSSRTLLYISCPILSSNYSDNSGGGSPGTDLTSTNMKLDTIIEILSAIAQQNEEDDSDNGETPVNDAPEYEENSDFAYDADSQLDDAESYFSDSSNDLPTEDAGSLLGYVWQFLQASRLAALFIGISLIKIVHWFIFGRGS